MSGQIFQREGGADSVRSHACPCGLPAPGELPRRA